MTDSVTLTLGKIAHLGLRVPDFDAALAWYEEKLGFRLLHRWAMGDRVFGMITSADGQCTFELMAGPATPPRPAFHDLPGSHNLDGWHHLCFAVADVDATTAELKRRGVEILNEPRDNPAIQSRFAFFVDPWRNIFEVMQPLAPK